MRNKAKDEKMRNAILEAGKTVFQKWGHTKTTMEDIAREAGKGKSSLYYYFASKEEIFDALLQREVGALFLRAKEAVKSETSAKTKLRSYLVACLAEMKAAASLYNIVLGEVSRNPYIVQRIRTMFEKQELNYIKEILRLGVTQNEYTFKNTRELNTAAVVILEITQALELSLFLNNYNSEHVDIAARLIANGI
jgi:AcrR family transcriptional regulator